VAAKTKYARDRKDVEELVSGMHRQIKGLEVRAAVEDPWVCGEMAKMASELDAAVLRTVKALRQAGYPWSEIGREMGISATTCIKRYANRIKQEGDHR
jgi:hypothetical protein